MRAASIDITLIDDETNKYTIAYTTSFFPKQAKQVAIREGFKWTFTGEDPREATRASITVDQIMQYLPDDGLKSRSWHDECQKGLGIQIKPDAFKTVRTKAQDFGKCHWPDPQKLDN